MGYSSSMNAEQRAKQWAEIVGKAWQDAKFRRRLLDHPQTIMQEQGLSLPAGVELRVVENSPQAVYLTLPADPSTGQGSDDGGSLSQTASAVNLSGQPISGLLLKHAIGGSQPVNRWDEIVTKAWREGSFKQRLLAEPRATFSEFGLDVPAGVELRVLENTDQILHLTLPPIQQGELSDQELESVSGGLVVIAIIGILIGPLLPPDPGPIRSKPSA
jgi:hypothetical protein